MPHYNLPHNHGPVSYTHLDVYKRQLQECMVPEADKTSTGKILTLMWFFPIKVIFEKIAFSMP